MNNILFICTANRDRSRTAEFLFQAKYPLYRFRSAGIDRYASERHGGVHVRQYMLDLADRIICMEHCHLEYIVQKIDKRYLSKIEVLEIGDHDTFMGPELITKLCEKFKI